MDVGISTREVYQVLAAVVARTGPIELTEDEIQRAPALKLEVTGEDRCRLSVVQ